MSEDVRSLQLLYPQSERLAQYSDGARLVVSEPLVTLQGAWREVSPSTALVVDGSSVQEYPFVPHRPG